MRKKSKPALGTDLDIPPTPPGFFRTGVMGKYYQEYVGRGGGKPLVVVGLEEDVAKDFPTAKAVNEGLRKLREIQRLVAPEKRRKTA